MTDERAEDAAVDSTGGRAAAESGFGERLAAEREQHGLSQADVARALNLRVAVIVALEEEDFGALPKMAFVRGYARSYARLLGFPEADIAEALASWRAPEDDGRLPLSPASVVAKRSLGSGLHGHAGLILTLLSILVVVVLGAVLVMIWPEGGFQAMRSESAAEPPAAAPAAAPATRSVPLSAPRLQLDAVDVPGADQAMGQEEAFADDGYDGSQAAEEAAAEAAAQAQQEATQLPTQGSRPDPAPPAAVADSGAQGAAAGFAVRRESVDSGRVLRVYAQGEDQVLLRFSSDCWVEIRDAEGRGIVSDLGREGQTFEVHGKGPFRILLGYAHGVEVTYNGEPVGLAPHIRNDIASLVVGR
ncbi:MAG: DUF4115 domain-containing protein [Gammaproteobacteria bacterium]|nr:DUF4115 domain-containing protein [Gammaproteobacteria bacterium]